MVETIKRYQIYAKRTTDENYTQWTQTGDAEEIEQHVSKIHEAGYLAAVKDTATGAKWSDTKKGENSMKNLQNTKAVVRTILEEEPQTRNFESVRRTRQKVQAECPWLAACPKVGEYRAENEQAYREFARG